MNYRKTKILFTDLDGTLLNGSFEWDQVIEQEISRVLEQGYDFAVATGRTEEGVKNCPGPLCGPIWTARACCRC